MKFVFFSIQAVVGLFVQEVTANGLNTSTSLQYYAVYMDFDDSGWSFHEKFIKYYWLLTNKWAAYFHLLPKRVNISVVLSR